MCSSGWRTTRRIVMASLTVTAALGKCWWFVLCRRGQQLSHWMYCHLVMCSETCMSKPCCQSLTSQYVERIHWILLGHYFITSTKGKACGWGGGWGARTIPSLQYAGSGGRWMSPTHPTHLSDHSTDLKQGRSHFPDRGCSLFSPGGFNSSLSVAQSGLQCQTPITHTLRGSRWISWPPGVGVTTPAVQSANTAV